MKTRGFTLLEVMVSVAVISIALTSVMYLLADSKRILDDATETRFATLDAQSILERIESTPFDNIPAEFPDGLILGEYNTLQSETAFVKYVNETADPLEITVTVTWENNFIGERSISLSTMRTR